MIFINPCVSPSQRHHRPSSQAAGHQRVAAAFADFCLRQARTAERGFNVQSISGNAIADFVVDDHLHTSVLGIWASGDCNGKGAFTHTAFNDAEIVGANLLDNDPRKVSDRITAYALFIDPPLGRAGLTEAEVRKGGRHALMAGGL